MGKDYYYIADQQVKASVYYVRYLNFLERSRLQINRINEISNDIERFSKFIGKEDFDNAKKQSTDYLKNTCQVLISEINNLSYEFQKEALQDSESYIRDIEDIKQKCLQYLDEIELSENIEYKKYIMFNNMMREIRFFGGAYQYLWHWKKEKKTLYRCGKLDIEQTDNISTSKQDYIKNMFQDCLNHMNSSSNIRHSYSENLLLDIYKYLILPTQTATNENLKTIFDENGIKITCNLFHNDKNVEFHIIKQANINSIFVNDNAKSFHEFVVGENFESYDFPYIVEMYQQTLIGERSDKQTIKGMRDWLLPIYFALWEINCSLSKTKVADDKEVITYGKCYTNQIKVDENTDYKSAECGTLFSMQLNKEDIIYIIENI